MRCRHAQSDGLSLKAVRVNNAKIKPKQILNVCTHRNPVCGATTRLPRNSGPETKPPSRLIKMRKKCNKINIAICVLHCAVVISAGSETAPSDGISREYCQWETFKARCSSDEVIVITRAIYGRPNFGRCIRQEYGYTGCFSDVRRLADDQCSGRQFCQIAVPDKIFDGMAPCREDLKLHLEIGYACIKGELSLSVCVCVSLAGLTCCCLGCSSTRVFITLLILCHNRLL